jgi:hypothetical protein
MIFYVLNAFIRLFTELFCANPQLKSSETYSYTFGVLWYLNSVAQQDVTGLK